MAIRVDTTSWIPGAILVGDTGFGVLGSEVPSTGDNGAGYLYNDLTLPADAGKEVCGRITSWPSAGTLYAYEDSSFTFIGAPDGSYSFEYQRYVDGVEAGLPVPVTLNVGEGIVSIPAASLTLTGYAPAIVQTAHNTIAVPAGTLALTGYAPAVAASGSTSIAVPAGALTLTGYAPSVLGAISTAVVAAARSKKTSNTNQRRANLSGARPSNRQ